MALKNLAPYQMGIWSINSTYLLDLLKEKKNILQSVYDCTHCIERYYYKQIFTVRDEAFSGLLMIKSILDHENLEIILPDLPQNMGCCISLYSYSVLKLSTSVLWKQNSACNQRAGENSHVLSTWGSCTPGDNFHWCKQVCG